MEYRKNEFSINSNRQLVEKSWIVPLISFFKATGEALTRLAAVVQMSSPYLF